MAWTELRVVDPVEHREARSRFCLGRSDNVHCLVTLDFWPEDEARLDPVWDRVVHSLRPGVWVADPGLIDDGWHLARTRGSHRQFKHAAKRGLVTVAETGNRDLAPPILKSFLKQAGLEPKQGSEGP